MFQEPTLRDLSYLTKMEPKPINANSKKCSDSFDNNEMPKQTTQTKTF